MHEKGHLSKDVSYPLLYLNYFYKYYVNIQKFFRFQVHNF